MTYVKPFAVAGAIFAAASLGLGVHAAAAAEKAKATITATDQSSAFSKTLAIRPSGVVDGKSYRKMFKSAIEVPAGNRVVDVQINVKFGFNEMGYQDRIPFRARLAPGRNYETRGRMSGRTVDVWIADTATNKLASKVLSITIERCYIRFTCPRPSLEIKPSL